MRHHSHINGTAQHAQLGGQIIDTIPTLSVDVVEIANRAATVAVAAAYDRNPLVRYAEPDGLAPLLDSPAVTPDDTLYNLSNATRQWHHPAIDSPQAWPVATGDGSLRLTVCDTGVLPTHEDLVGQVLTGEGINTADEPVSTNFLPVHWHGTAVSGSAAAVGNNNLGVAGVNWVVGIVPVRISNVSSGGAFFSDMVQCILYGAGVSVGGFQLPQPSVAINLSYQTYSSNGTISATILGGSRRRRKASPEHTRNHVRPNRRPFAAALYQQKNPLWGDVCARAGGPV